jgi:hypothetical protein
VANVIAATAHSGLSALYGAGTDKGIGWKPSHLKPEFFEKQRGGEEHIAIILMMRRINWSRQPQQTMLTRSRISSAKPVKAATTTFVFAIKCAHWKPMDRFPVFCRLRRSCLYYSGFTSYRQPVYFTSHSESVSII